MGRRGVVTAAVCGAFGLVALIVGGVLIPVLHNLTVKKIDQQIPIKEGSNTYDAWLNPSSAAPIYFQAFVFHVVNSWEVVHLGKKPVLQQRGPYTYREQRHKVNVTFHDNGTVSYRELHFYEFDRRKSVGSENDVFTTINLPMLTLATLLRYEYEVILIALDALFASVGESLYLEVSVGGILWGYEDPLLKEAKEILADFNISLPIDDKFGLFYKQNGSDDGLYTVYTGTAGLDDFAMIESWNGMRVLDYWTAEQANQINGSDGTMYPPFVDKGDTLYLFSSDIGRSVYGLFTEESSVDDIDLLRFVPPPQVFFNHSLNPANVGFCVPAGNCLDSGVLNISVFRQGAPVIMSQPHFLDAAKQYINGVEGMNPVPEEHSTFFDVEPTTGVAMHVAKRLQVNVYIEKISNITDLEKFSSPVIHPVMWLNESGKITTKSAADFKRQVQQPMRLAKALIYALLITGTFTIILVVAFVTRRIYLKKIGLDELKPVVSDKDTSALVNGPDA